MIQGTLKIDIGDKVILKKKHPCGGTEWEVIRTGADVKIKCLTCGHIVLLDRSQLRKKIKKIVEKEAER
jgi:hypothetical protein